MTLAHWDDVPDCMRIGMRRVLLKPGQSIAPPHLDGAGEEIVHVLAGTATLSQGSSVAAGDTIVQPPTLLAGDDGLEALIFGTRSFLLPTTERPPNVVALDDVVGDYGGMRKRLGEAGGAKLSGLNLITLPPNEEGAPPHCHTAEEELFVVLDGAGTLELWGPPRPGEPPATEPQEAHPLERGHVVSRPAGTKIAHCLRSGEPGLTYLAYGTREPNDVCYYPRSNKISFRGLGLIARLEPLDFFDGEPS